MIENMSHAQSLLTVAMVTDAGSTKIYSSSDETKVKGGLSI